MEQQFTTFNFFSVEEQKTLVSQREGEVRIGQEVLFRSENSEDWKNKRFHILGITEDIGPQLNKGFKGADRAFSVFLPRFLAVQSTTFLNGNDCCVHGTIHVDSTEMSQSAILELDKLVEQWAYEVSETGGIPIVIGGGHNNALGLIAGTSAAKGEPLSVVNLDPHADVRKTDERHSGNSFSFAHERGIIRKYAILGLHENYNNQFILDKLTEMGAWSCYFESWIDDPQQFYSDIEEVIRLVRVDPVGIELDMDSIAFMPSSAFTPSGVTVEQARYYIRKLAKLESVAYVHFPEAAPVTEMDDKSVGKTLCYLVTDFIKVSSNV